jgi:hypothetical protein
MIGRRRRNSMRAECSSYSCGLNSRKALAKPTARRKDGQAEVHWRKDLDLNRILKKSIRRPNGAYPYPASSYSMRLVKAETTRLC